MALISDSSEQPDKSVAIASHDVRQPASSNPVKFPNGFHFNRHHMERKNLLAQFSHPLKHELLKKKGAVV